MLRRLPLNASALGIFAAAAVARWQLVALLSVFVALVIAGAFQYQRQAAGSAAEQAEDKAEAKSVAATPGRDASPAVSREVYATWYEVPRDSLARRRAGPHELTAAHNRLPIGTLLRVTHLKNGKSVIVRITDRGVPAGKAKLDLCKEAAEKLEMMDTGTARVRYEINPDQHSRSPADAHTAARQQ